MAFNKSYGGRRHKGNLEDHAPLEPDYDLRVQNYLEEFARKGRPVRERPVDTKPQASGGERRG
ncbi:MAG: hypothetical protein AAB801_02980 [Patescibacteria group bacterium]